MHTLLAQIYLEVSAVFAAAGGLLLVAPRLGGPQGFQRVTGSFLLVAAALMLVPVLRLAGIGLAGFVLFLAANTLISRRRYMAAAPVVAILFALIPVTLSP